MDRMSHRLIGVVGAYAAKLVVVLADSAALLASVLVALALRFEYLPWDRVYQSHLREHIAGLPVALAIYLAAFGLFRLYRCAWRFAGLEMLWGIVCANTIGVAGLVMVQLVLDERTFPRSVLVMVWAGGIVLTGAERVLLRVLSVARRHGIPSLQMIRGDVSQKRAVILGAGSDGVAVLRTVRDDPELRYSVVGFLDDDPCKKGVYVSGVKVLDSLTGLKRLYENRAIDLAIVALPEITDERISNHIAECRRDGLPVKVIPRTSDVLTGRSSVRLVDFSVEDLLRRAPAVADYSEFGEYLTGARVLVTGAGGSIGSELCRQIASLRPASLVLLGHGENSIHQIYCELRAAFPEMAERIDCAIASVSHTERIGQVFRRYRPGVVFHAAAHKHVPMMEENEQEAVHNNVLGTRCIAEACGRYGVERVVLVSTDKAADPCCVMGITKWLCEEVFRAAAARWAGTRFIGVRFGNVLGSRGSVVPVFCEQIRRGGPVTVTHPEMTRYFMTIPEAVRLVLGAGAIGKTGELYLLDMGRPVKIVDLAKQVVRLNGLEPGKDIEFEFTGIRPGEKLHEKLVSDDERIEPTPWKGLSVIRRPVRFTPARIAQALAGLETASNHGTAADVRGILDDLVAARCGGSRGAIDVPGHSERAAGIRA